MDNEIGQSRRVRLIAGIVASGMVASILFHYVLAEYLHLGYPFSTFLFRPEDALNDFKNMYHIVKNLSPYGSGYWFDSNYFPLCNLMFYPFTLISSPGMAAIAFLFCFLAVYAVVLSRLHALRRIEGLALEGLIFLTFFNYPMLYALDRANIELYLFIDLILFAYFFHGKKNYLVADIFLAVAISMKLYPGVFLVLYIKERKHKHIFYIALMCFALTFASLALFRGSISENLRDFLTVLSSFNRSSMGANGVQHNSTIFGLLKILALVFGVFLRSVSPGTAMTAFETAAVLPYSVLCILAFLGISILVLRRRIGIHGLWLVLTCIMIAFPTVSYDYKLIHLLIPLWIFLQAGDRSRFSRVLCALYAFILIPKDYLILNKDVSISSMLNPIFLVAMITLGIIDKDGEGDLRIAQKKEGASP
jgi:hypothetical protein